MNEKKMSLTRTKRKVCNNFIFNTTVCAIQLNVLRKKKEKKKSIVDNQNSFKRIYKYRLLSYLQLVLFRV